MVQRTCRTARARAALARGLTAPVPSPDDCTSHARFLAAFCLLLLTLLPASLEAGEPWLAPGDVQVRHDIQLLVDAGVINLPMSAWPIAVSDLATCAGRRTLRLDCTACPNRGAGKRAVDRPLQSQPKPPPCSACVASLRRATHARLRDLRRRASRHFAHVRRHPARRRRTHRRTQSGFVGTAFRRASRGLRRRRSGRRQGLPRRRLLRCGQVRQLDRDARGTGALVGFGLGRQPDPVEQCASGAGDCAGSCGLANRSNRNG